MLKEEILAGYYDAGEFFKIRDFLEKKIQIEDGKIEVSVEPLSVRCIVLDKVNINS